jgi:hypothetical protein
VDVSGLPVDGVTVTLDERNRNIVFEASDSGAKGTYTIWIKAWLGDYPEVSAAN